MDVWPPQEFHSGSQSDENVAELVGVCERPVEVLHVIEHAQYVICTGTGLLVRSLRENRNTCW